MAHCLQFDLVATDDTIEAVKDAINDLCISHIEFSIEHDNIDNLFHPAPPEAWAAFYRSTKDPACSIRKKEVVLKDTAQTIPAFMIQEIYCNEQTAVWTQIQGIFEKT